MEVRGLLGNLQRVESLRDHFQLPGILQFAEQRAVKSGHEALRVACAPEIGTAIEGFSPGLLTCR